MPCRPDSLVVGDVVVRQDAHGRYCLNDLHRAAVAQGANQRTKEPGKFLANPEVTALIDELAGGQGDTQNLGIAPVESIRGGPDQGTYVCRELVYAYAMWVDATYVERPATSFDASRP